MIRTLYVGQNVRGSYPVDQPRFVVVANYYFFELANPLVVVRKPEQIMDPNRDY